MKYLLIILLYIDRFWVSIFNIKSGDFSFIFYLFLFFLPVLPYYSISLGKTNTEFLICLNNETQIINAIIIGPIVEFLHLKRKITLKGSLSLCDNSEEQKNSIHEKCLDDNRFSPPILPNSIVRNLFLVFRYQNVFMVIAVLRTGILYLKICIFPPEVLVYHSSLTHLFYL